MRHVQIEDQLRVRFPKRSAEFVEGVEVGVSAVLMASSTRPFSRRLGSDSLDQLRALAPKLGYRLCVVESGQDWSDVRFERGQERPRLVLAHSRPAEATALRPAAAVSRRELGARRAELRSV